MQVTIECQERPAGSKPKALRREGLIPAALYGHKGDESISLTIDSKDVKDLLRSASVNNTLVEVKIPHLSWNGKALIREVQKHPWKPELYHLSFFAVSAQDTLTVVVPVNLMGEALGVKEGGIVDQIITEVQVQCAPDKIPESIDIDVSGLEMGSNMHLHEVALPGGVTLLDDPERTVVTVVAPRAVVEEAAEAEEPDILDTVELEGPGPETEAETETETEEV